MILTSAGVPFAYAAPAPSAELERTLRAALKDMDPLLDVRWIPTVFRNERHQRWEGRYALTCTWPRADKRWGMVQSGEVPESDALDIIGWLCEDMQDAQSVPTSLDGIQSRVLALLGTMDNTRYPWKERMMAAVGKNVARQRALKNDALNLTHDAAEHFYRQAKGVPQSVGANFDKEGRLVK